jgi:hypothetical protein
MTFFVAMQITATYGTRSLVLASRKEYGGWRRSGLFQNIIPVFACVHRGKITTNLKQDSKQTDRDSDRVYLKTN